MDKIICLVGPSGSGKTTIAKELEKEGYNVIQSYTTRKPRHKGEWGHIFVSKNAINHVNEWDLVAIKELYEDYYWSTKDQYQGKGTSIYVVDPDGAEQVRENVKDAKVITIFLMVDEEVREARLLYRVLIREGLNEKEARSTAEIRLLRNENIETTNIPDRIEKDRKIFSKCKCDYVVDANRELNKVVEDIKEIIETEEN